MNWIINALVKMLPAYLGNSFPVFFGKMFPKLTSPIDGGRMAKDGNRILGDGKTWLGVVASFVGGALGGWIANIWGIGSVSSGMLIGFSAIFGDSIGSFTKRRLKMKRGDNAGLLDQMDFITASLIVASFFQPFTLAQVILILVSTPLIHRVSNIIGYKLKLKSVPW